ncbi:MAG: class I SAM-dependent DNA methyltransferase, partial [Deltaproteobacteria bacterium]|jgi:hypothetical protein|nr:class I SAM-dependent DNA methyltransferase [Deltaproteobacteria bacterium]
MYLHRYRSDTVSVVLNRYLREYLSKLSSEKVNLEKQSRNPSYTQAQKTRALKEIEKIKKVLNEIDDYERKTLYPLAASQLEIDLDDGVRTNYLKFGTALKKIKGLDKIVD